jgi:hypothetical protein
MPDLAGVPTAKAESWSGPLSLSCLRSDYLTKLRNKTSAELRTLRACPAEAIGVPASVDWVGCLRLSSIMLGPKQVHTLWLPMMTNDYL